MASCLMVYRGGVQCHCLEPSSAMQMLMGSKQAGSNAGASLALVAAILLSCMWHLDAARAGSGLSCWGGSRAMLHCDHFTCDVLVHVCRT
jgi:hypothetical protein